MKKIVLALALIAFLAACSSQEPNAETPTITVLTSPDYPPYESVATDGSYEGFDIELMEALAAKMGVTVVWKEQAFDGIIAAIQSSQGDMAISGMNVSEERLKSVDFSDIYKADGNLYTAVVKKEDGFTSITDLNGKIIGVQTGTVQEGAMNSIASKYSLTVSSQKAFATIIEDIKLDRVDALVIDSTNAATYAEQDDSLMTFELTDEALSGKAGTAIAFPKGSEWVEKVNTALAELDADGTLAQLDAKWFPAQ